MIQNIKHRKLKKLYERNDTSGFPSEYVKKIRLIMARLDSALVIEDLDIQGFRLHQLKGDYQGYWSVTVLANWRIIFKFESGMATEIDYIDYH